MAGFYRWSGGLFPRPWWVDLGNWLATLLRGMRQIPRASGFSVSRYPRYSRKRKTDSMFSARRSGFSTPRLRAPRAGWGGMSSKPPRRGPVFVRILLLAVLGIVIFAIIDWRLRPTLHQLATARARVLATEAVTSAVALEIAEGIRWEDLYALRPDSAGKVVLVQPNTGEIDRLTSKVTLRVQEYLNKINETRIRIPLGQILGTHVLANVGPRIVISITPIGTVTTRILSDFEQAGINQIRHKIYLEVTAHMQVIVPMVVATDDIVAQVPITEVLIMGDVPETYIQVEGKGFKDLFPAE
ncbi:MAG: sporulation protein YunB [Firmicutes bacterium]|nr:sporulation protein YunB [Bacillota bacterium]